MVRTDLLLPCLLAVLAGAPRIASAQPGSGDDDPTSQAAVAFARAQAAAAEEDFVTALEAFREAQRLAPHDAVRFNIALCLERLGRFSEALAEFEHAASSDQLSDEQRQDAQRRGEQSRARLGHLHVTSPEGAGISVDGIERCTAPCTVDVDPGRHRVSAAGTTDSRTIELRAGDQIDLALTTAPVTPPPPPPRRRPSGGLRVGVVGWIGVGLAGVGAISTTIFGLRVLSLKDDYLADPTQERLDDGRLAVTLTNVSLVGALLGAALFAVDVLLLEHGQPDEAPTARAGLGSATLVW